jgi:hypothetical protein
MEFAKETTVSPEKSKAEIEEQVRRFGATAFQSGWDGGHAFVMFRVRERFVRFDLALPIGTEERFKKKPNPRYPKDRWRDTTRTPEEIKKIVEQEIRTRWRALLLSIKAKLAGIEAGIETFESAFLPYVLLPDGRTVATAVLPLIAQAYETGKMPTALALPPHLDTATVDLDGDDTERGP